MSTLLSRGRLFLGDRWRRAKITVARWGGINHLDPCETEAIARDLYLSASELCSLAKSSPRASTLLGRRLNHIGLSEHALAQFHGDVLRDLQRVCGLCPAKARCAADLKRERRASPSKYCPNEQTLQTLSRELAERPSARIVQLYPDRS